MVPGRPTGDNRRTRASAEDDDSLTWRVDTCIRGRRVYGQVKRDSVLQGVIMVLRRAVGWLTVAVLGVACSSSSLLPASDAAPTDGLTVDGEAPIDSARPPLDGGLEAAIPDAQDDRDTADTAPDARDAADAADTAPDAPNDAGSTAIPIHAPTLIAFQDQDMAASRLGGQITIDRAIDESNIRSYKLYWGSDATTKLAATPPLASLPSTGSNVFFSLDKAVPPPGATHLLAFSANSVGEMATGVSVEAMDHFSTYRVLSTTQEANRPSLALDVINGKALVVGERASDSMISIFRTDLPAGTTTSTPLSTLPAGIRPSAVVDAINGRLLVAFRDNTRSTPGLFRCNLDATGCVFLNISAGAPNHTGYDPSLVIDEANGKLLVVTTAFGVNKNMLFRCDLDGTNCAAIDISAGQPNGSGSAASAVIDPINDKLLVVAKNGTSLVRCDLDGMSCVKTDISAGIIFSSSARPSAVVDPLNGKLLVLSQHTGSKLSLVRCNLDGGGCTYADLSVAKSNAGSFPAAVIDFVHNKLLVAAQRGSDPGVFRCDLEGTNCIYLDLKPPDVTQSGLRPSVAIDAANGHMLIATCSNQTVCRPALFSFELW